MDDYNYAAFAPSEEEMGKFDRFFDAPNAGTIAPDFPLEDLATGERVHLKELWKRDAVVMEFGSYS